MNWVIDMGVCKNLLFPKKWGQWG